MFLEELSSKVLDFLKKFQNLYLIFFSNMGGPWLLGC